MRKFLHLTLSAIALSTTICVSQIRITEVMSSSAGLPATPDWFEITNFGTTSVDITGWKMDDNSLLYTSAVQLEGITSIPAGKSIIFLETDNPATDISAFKAFWGTSLNNATVGYYPSSGKGVGFSSNGDALIVFNAAGNEVNKVNFGAASAGKSFFWSYNAEGLVVDNAVISSVGTISGTISNQVTIKSTGNTDTASPGTAIVLPLNANTLNPSIKPWRLEGRTLKFDVLPTQKVELLSLTGLKVFSHEPAREIKLNLSQGIYIVKVDGKATKILFR